MARVPFKRNAIFANLLSNISFVKNLLHLSNMPAKANPPPTGLKFIYLRVINVLNHLYLKRLGVELDPTARVLGRPIIKRKAGSRIVLGAHACLFSAPYANPLRPQERAVLHTVTAGAEIILERGVGVSSSTLVARKSILIKEGTMIGADCLIVDNDFHPLDPSARHADAMPEAKPVVIGRDVFIGARCIILKGVKIGDGAVIGAGSVVSRNIPANIIAAGNPARVIRKL